LARSLADPKIGIAAQNVFDRPSGAFTGELGVEQLKDAKVEWAIVGHSERRVILKEDDDVGFCFSLSALRGRNGWISYCTQINY
jgi:triosephosphate isomerase